MKSIFPPSLPFLNRPFGNEFGVLLLYQGWGSVPSTGLQDGLFPPPTGKGIHGAREQEEPVSNIQLGKGVFPSTCRMLSPELCPTIPEPGKSPGAAGAEGIPASTFPVFWCIPAWESSRGTAGCLSCPWVAVRKVRPLRGHPSPLLPLLAWAVSVPPQALPGLWLREGALRLQHSFSFFLIIRPVNWKSFVSSFYFYFCIIVYSE